MSRFLCIVMESSISWKMTRRFSDIYNPVLTACTAAGKSVHGIGVTGAISLRAAGHREQVGSVIDCPLKSRHE